MTTVEMGGAIMERPATVRTVDGARLVGTWFEPAHPRNASTAVLVVCGAGIPARFYEHFARALALVVVWRVAHVDAGAHAHRWLLPGQAAAPGRRPAVARRARLGRTPAPGDRPRSGRSAPISSNPFALSRDSRGYARAVDHRRRLCTTRRGTAREI